MDVKIFAKTIDETAKSQIKELASQDCFKDSKIRVMPDVHGGKGCVIGFTGNLGNKVVPNIVGVDIGCGMLCIKLDVKDIDLSLVDEVVRKYIPSGMNISEELDGVSLIESLRCKNNLKSKDSWLYKSLGTLGGGNHFIEIDEDENGYKYLVIHTGSRNIGKQVAKIYQDKAIEYCSFANECELKIKNTIKDLKLTGREKEIKDSIFDIKKQYDGMLKMPKDLCYLESKDMLDYLFDMSICVKYASANRYKIANKILEKLGIKVLEDFTTIHNYIDDNNMVRKGAISAKNGEKLLIPINMRDGCIIGVGKGNDDWNCSAPHGAGRLMSRSKAKELLSMNDYREEMSGIFSTSVNENTLDEAPMAYKPIEEILECINDTVDVIDIIKPIYNFKASDD